MGRDALRENVDGPAIVGGLCIDKGAYCASCNGTDAVNCNKSPEHHKIYNRK